MFIIIQLLGTSSLDSNIWLVVERTAFCSLQNFQQQLFSVSELVHKGDQWEEGSHVVSSVAELVGQVRATEDMYAYLSWLRHIHTLRYALLTYAQINGDIVRQYVRRRHTVLVNFGMPREYY